MLEVQEGPPERETIKAREALEKGIFELLLQRGVKVKKVLSKRCFITIHLDYDDFSRGGIPASLISFVRERYEGRSVGIGQIEINYGRESEFAGTRVSRLTTTGHMGISVVSLYPRTPEEVEKAKQRINLPKEEILGLPTTESVFNLEQKDGFQYVIIPDKNLVLTTSISLYPFKTPMEYSLTSFPLNEWLIKDDEPKAEGITQRRLDPIWRIADPHNLGFAEIARRPTKFLLGEIEPKGLTGVLPSKIVLAIASIIPNRPEVESQPRKEIIIT